MSAIGEHCMHNGWLLKRGEVIKGWKKRWFEIRDGHAFYYKYPDDAKALGAIDLNPCSTRVVRYDTDNVSVTSPRNEKIFRVVTPKRTWILAAESEVEMNEWVNHFQNEQNHGNTDLLQTSATSITKCLSAPISNSPRKSTNENASQLETQLRESQARIDELEREKEEQSVRIEYLEGQLAVQQKETATFARMMSEAAPSDPTDLKDELHKSKTNLVAQLSHVSILSNDVQRLEQELIQAQKELQTKDANDLSEMRKRYNFVERKLAFLCSKVS